MELLHDPSAVTVRCDELNLVSCAGLVPALGLAGRCGLGRLVASTVTLRRPGGVNAHLKVPALVGGMVAGADSIADMDLLRHGAMGRLFGGIRAPSTLGTFLRAFTFGHVRQLDAVAAIFLARLGRAAPLLPGAEAVAFLDIDDTIRSTFGYAKQGAGRGYSGVAGLNVLLATVTTPTGRPVIAGSRLRKGSCNSARGAAKLVADTIVAARNAGATGLLVVRADSAFYGHAVVAAARRAGARFSVTARMTATVTAAIATIPDDQWRAIRYPNAVWDTAEQRWISDAEIAEVGYTAFTGRRRADHVTARLIVRRVRRLNPAHAPAGQGELFAAYRYHACFTDSPMPLVDAESDHRGHAIIEQVNADLKAGPLAHLPSGSFAANAAWLVLATIAFNLTRATGTLASAFHARATTATIRTQLINVPGRIARSARRLTLHLPHEWPWWSSWEQLHHRVSRPPPAVA
jgi:hypothetical protein